MSEQSCVLGRRALATAEGEPVEITLWVPIKSDDHPEEAKCEYRVASSKRTTRRSTYGVDPLQALQLALMAIGSELKLLQERGEILNWAGHMLTNDVGFPTLP